MTVLLVILSVVEVVLVLGVLVAYLVVIIRSLRRSSQYLAKVSFGVRAIETQTASIGPSVLRINARLRELAGGLHAAAQLVDGARDR